MPGLWSRVFSPLDEELALLPGSLFPRHQEGLVRLSSWMPFGKAAQLLQDLLEVSCSKATARRHTQAAGAAYVALQTEAADSDCGTSALRYLFSPRLGLSPVGWVF